MKKDFDFDNLLKKVQELNDLFIFAQRVVPFLEEVFVFIKDIKPVLEEFNSSVEDNLKKMPNASKQLSKVTEATEIVTTEIMDIADGITHKSNSMTNNLDKINTIFYKLLENDANIMTEEIKTTFDNLIEDSKSLNHGVRNDSSSIFQSLQVQDVTSQQLAAVNNIIQTIHHKLLNILNKFNNATNDDESIDALSETRETLVSQMHREIAFDSDVLNTNIFDSDKQVDVDDFINKHINGVDSDLTSNTSSNTKKPEREHKENVLNKLPINESLINQVDVYDQVSQDDIDKMFV